MARTRKEISNQLRNGLFSGIKKGWSSFIWICKIVVPVSFLVALLQWSGWLYHLNFVLSPLMKLIDLPSEAALPIINGMVINLYAAIATMNVLKLTIPQMTLIAIFTLIAHNMIVEGIIQLRSGINIFKITLIRIGVAIITVLIVSRFFGNTSESVTLPSELTSQVSFLVYFKGWLISTLTLILKVLGIVMGIMVTLECLKSVGWLDHIFNFFKPFMKVLGLSSQTSMLWVTAVIFGLMYGGALIIEEANRGNLTHTELERLHISIGINHSMVEDPALFMAMGLNGFWMWIPKLVMAVVTVQLFRFAGHLKSRAREPVLR